MTRWHAWPTRSEQRAGLLARAATFLRPEQSLQPDEWARRNRSHPATSGHPGERDPSLTPYVIPIERAAVSGLYRRVVAVMGSQMGKTEGQLDLMGHRLSQRPAPILYVGPTREFVVDQFEPRVMQLLDNAPRLSAQVARGKRMKKTRKLIAGVPLRLAHGGSSSALKSDPAALAFVDEYDEMLANIKGQGDPLGLVEARGDTYADFVTVITSTPSQGFVETEIDPVSGLEFWKVADPDGIGSPIWKVFQEGTRFHWAWPCQMCGEYFIPRFRNLKFPTDKTPAQARRETFLVCPREGCGGVHEYGLHCEAMNAAGRFVAPGQTIDRAGNVEGAPPDSSTFSTWVSGLASPFVSWGDRVERYLQAFATGEEDKVQTAINAGTGECYAHGSRGEVPDWHEVLNKRVPYSLGDVPNEVMRLTAGVDVQKNSILYVIRGWGWRGSSWLLGFGQLYGSTSEDQVWGELSNILLTPIGDQYIERAFVDSGFRPNKSDQGDEHRVYEFCRSLPWLAYATKGHDVQTTPTRQTQIEITARGQKARFSISLVHLNTDHWKSFVHSAVRLPIGSARSFHVPMGEVDRGGFHQGGITEEYARQIVSEARTRSPEGKPVWVKRARDNHFLDCFDRETELLTDRGWMPVAEAVSYRGDFATVNLDRDVIEYQPALSAVSREHAGEMVEIKGKSLDLLVTPNHRMVTARRNPTSLSLSITLAKDLTAQHTLKKSSSWVGEDMRWVDFPEVSIPIAKRGGLYEPARSVDAGDWFEFLGWFVSEGHTRAVGRSRSVILTQNPGEKQDIIRACLDRLGFRYRVTGGRQFVVTSRQVYTAVQDCMEPGLSRGCYRKRVPALVKAASPALIARFVDAAILGDGWVQNGFRTYATVSKALADGMQELFLKLGNSANVRVRKAVPHAIRMAPSATTVDQFHVSETKMHQAQLRRSNGSLLVRRVEYAGPVYCVTVPNGTLIARRNGVPCIVGNCEAMAAAAAYQLGVQTIPEGAVRVEGAPRAARAPAPPSEPDGADPHPPIPLADDPAGPVPLVPPPGPAPGTALRSRFANLSSRMNR